MQKLLRKSRATAVQTFVKIVRDATRVHAKMLIIGVSHLRRVLASYAAYYNQVRTHLALQKDAPL
jgi:hypothetical protein